MDLQGLENSVQRATASGGLGSQFGTVETLATKQDLAVLQDRIHLITNQSLHTLMQAYIGNMCIYFMPQSLFWLIMNECSAREHQCQGGHPRARGGHGEAGTAHCRAI